MFLLRWNRIYPVKESIRILLNFAVTIGCEAQRGRLSFTLPPSHLGNSNEFDCTRFGVG